MANVANAVVAALERTRFSLLVAFFVIAPAISLTAREAVLATAPTCEASLRRADFAPAAHVAETTPERSPLGQPHAPTKTLMWIEQELERDPQSGSVVAASLVLHANDAVGPLECGNVRLHGGSLEPRASGDYMYFDTRHGDASHGAVRVVVSPSRHMQSARIFARANLPLTAALIALAMFIVAALRVRRAGLYVERVRHWREADLREGGRVEDDHGGTLGVFAAAQTALEPGPVLVPPEGFLAHTSYRDVPIMPRRLGAHGTHAEWASVTLASIRSKKRPRRSIEPSSSRSSRRASRAPPRCLP